MTSQENSGETRQYKGRSINVRVITFIQDKSLVNSFHTLTKITFKSFLFNNYSLGHEGRKTIHTLDFHRNLIWISLNTNLFWHRKTKEMPVLPCLDFLRICHQLIHLLYFWDRVHVADIAADPSASTFQTLWLQPWSPGAGGLARALCMLGNTLPTESCSCQPQDHFCKCLRLPIRTTEGQGIELVLMLYNYIYNKAFFFKVSIA